MKRIIRFSVEKGLDGYYVASAKNFFIVTQAKNLEKLIFNIKEATLLYFNDADKMNKTINKNISINITYELSLFLPN